MKLARDIWLPDAERHFAESPHVGARYPVLDRALSFLPRDRRRVAVDVGAHIGLWSRWLVGEFKHVRMFEPVAEYADLIASNVPGQNYILHRCALGDEARRVAIKTYPENTGQAHISGVGTVPMCRLDSFRLTNVDLIKIDVEGYELQVVKGAQNTIMENKPLIVIEQRGMEVINFGETIRDSALLWLKTMGMREHARVHHDLVLGW